MARQHYLIATALMAALSLAACNGTSAPTAPAADAAAEGPVRAVTAQSTLTPTAGAEVQTINALEDSSEVGSANGVVQLDFPPNQAEGTSVRLYGTAGGDPAANGLMTYLVFDDVHSDKTFLIGNFIAYRLLGASPGKVDLEIDETTADNDGNLGMRTYKVIVSWSEPLVEEAGETVLPTTITVTPAQ